MAGPKHMEVQAEAWPTASRSRRDGTVAVPYPCGQQMSLNPQYSTWLCPGSLKLHLRRLGQCHWNHVSGRGAREGASLCWGWAQGQLLFPGHLRLPASA